MALYVRSLGVGVVFFVALFGLLQPLFHDMKLYGFHDWDSHSAYRHIMTICLKQYHELPFWHPWMSGGFPAWGYIEGVPTLVSPYLPAYLLFPIQVAERIEILGEITAALITSYLLAGRLTSSAAVRAFVAVVFAINGRVALQVSTGHTWHLEYAWVPLVLYLFDIGTERRSLKWLYASAAALALMVYQGGIYPVPQTAIVLVLYAGFMVIASRSFYPVFTVSIVGLCALGFAAPKLFPMVDLMMRFPRKVESTETVNLNQLLIMFTEPRQSYAMAPIGVPQWGWHEYGIYVGIVPFAAMLIGLIFGSGRRGVAFKIIGFLFLVLGMGAFHKHSPWSELHKFPPFSSQHVPTRFLHLAVLFLLLAFAGAVGRFADRWVKRYWVLDIALLVPVFFVAVDIAQVGALTTQHSFFMQGPAMVPVSPEFRQKLNPPVDYTPGDWSGALLLSMFANTGCIKCYGVAEMGAAGAIAADAPGYRGEAYMTGDGSAKIVGWSPNKATVEYNAPAGGTLVYNMNYDPSWKANGRPAVKFQEAVAAQVPPGKGQVVFSYYPRTMNPALLIFLLTVGACSYRPVRDRWRRRTPKHSVISPPLPA